MCDVLKSFMPGAVSISNSGCVVVSLSTLPHHMFTPNCSFGAESRSLRVMSIKSLASSQLLAQIEVELRQHATVQNSRLILPSACACKLLRGGLSQLGLSAARFRAFAINNDLRVGATTVLAAAIAMFINASGAAAVDPSLYRRLKQLLVSELSQSSQASGNPVASDSRSCSESMPLVDADSIVDLVSDSDVEAIPAALAAALVGINRAPTTDADDYDNLSKDECIAALRSKDKVMQSKDAFLKTACASHRTVVQKLRRSGGKIKTLRAKLKQAIMKNEFDVEKRGSKRLTPRGVLCVAIRRNISNVSARTFGTAVLEDIGKDTVVRAELQTAAALTAWSRSFHASGEAVIEGSDWGIAVHSCRSDATNSAVWHNSKLFSSDVDSVYVSSEDLADGALPEDAISRHHARGELQRVGDSSTA